MVPSTRTTEVFINSSERQDFYVKISNNILLEKIVYLDDTSNNSNLSLNLGIITPIIV